MSHFVPSDAEAHAKANAGRPVPDRCANCGREFADHNNGKCPDDEE